MIALGRKKFWQTLVLGAMQIARSALPCGVFQPDSTESAPGFYPAWNSTDPIVPVVPLFTRPNLAFFFACECFPGITLILPNRGNSRLTFPY